MEEVMQLLDVNREPTAFLHIHLAFFMELGPKSLKSARQVCKEWNQFIKSQIWMNKEMRKRLEKRLVQQWRMNQPSKRELQFGEKRDDWREVVSVCCNETHVAVFCRVVLLADETVRLRLYSLADLGQVGEERDTGMTGIIDGHMSED